MANAPMEMEGSAKMPEGYAKLSSLMSTDSEFAIFRKFGALNAQNLLYYQAELMGLENDLRVTASEDQNSGDPDKKDFAVNWYELSHAKPDKNYQFRKFMQVRRILREYSMHIRAIGNTDTQS